MDKSDDKGRTPLYRAVWAGHIKVVQALVDAGADWTKKSVDGKTAMDIAKKEGFQEIALLLEQAGAS
jgi:ankyrin repeat protein